MKKNLQAIYLRVDSSSKSLTKRALAQLLLKIVYFLDTPPTKEQISNELAGILGATVGVDRIDEALNLLSNDGKISLVEGVYTISKTNRAKIDETVSTFVDQQDRIIRDYFGPILTPTQFVTQWFEQVTIEFFSEYSSEWISDLCHTTSAAVKSRYRGIQEILDTVTRDSPNVLEKDREWLKAQYLKFLSSSDSDVSAILWDYGTSRFSSSLIVANTAADPITIDEFRNSKCILDTNILMYLGLEKSKFKQAFESMETIFVDLGISPVYFFITRDEFSRAMDYTKRLTIKVVENFSPEVTSKAVDPFLQTALHRQCDSVEDFELFFDDMMRIPQTFSEMLEINIEDFAELDAAIQAGQNNEPLKQSINAVYKRKSSKDKRMTALKHDAGLISGAEHLRKTEKCFILSRDSTINESALEKQARNEIPISIGLGTLINLLAIDNGGTEIDPTNCAPLFASIIKLALIPERNIFRLEDLSRMLDVETQIASLPPEHVIDIAKEFHFNNVAGVSDEDLSLQLNRRFQSAKIEWQSEMDKEKLSTSLEKTEKEKYINRFDKAKQKLRETYTADLMRKYDDELFRNRILLFLGLPVVTILVFGLIIFQTSRDESLWTSELINLCVNIVAWFILDFFFVGKRLRNVYAERINGISDEVEKMLRIAIQD